MRRAIVSIIAIVIGWSLVSSPTAPLANLDRTMLSRAGYCVSAKPAGFTPAHTVKARKDKYGVIHPAHWIDGEPRAARRAYCTHGGTPHTTTTPSSNNGTVSTPTVPTPNTLIPGVPSVRHHVAHCTAAIPPHLVPPHEIPAYTRGGVFHPAHESLGGFSLGHLAACFPAS